MKKKIVIGLTMLLFIFLVGGIYIITAIENATSKLNNLITLHQVELLREQLLFEVKRVQSDLSLKNTRYARGIDTVVTNVQNMERMSDSCFKCHHTTEVFSSLKELKQDIQEYKKSISRVLTIRANKDRLKDEEDKAFLVGEHLLSKVNAMINMAGIKLDQKTRLSLDEISDTKAWLYVLLTVVPLLIAGLGYFFIRDITKPVNKLLDATQKLESGNLDYRIRDMKDEYGIVAASFNRMADSIKLHMREIQESEKRYRMLFENAGDAILILSAEGKNVGTIISANRAAAEMHGFTVDELVDMNMLTDLVSGSTGEITTRNIQSILKGQNMKAEVYLKKKDSTTFPVEMSAGIFNFMDRKYILTFNRDMSERRRIEKDLQRAQQMRIAGEWAAGLAHEIKNSLAGIKISVEVLGSELGDNETNRQDIKRAIDETKRIELLLKSLLNFAKPPEPHLSPVELNILLDKSIDYSLAHFYSSYSEPEGIKVIKKYGRSMPEVMVDHILLRQVFVNLLINSLEIMNGRGTIAIGTEYLADSGSFKITIADSGPGIDYALSHRVFKPFFTTKKKGNGLGLAISKRFVELHGGNIWVTKYDRGAEFCISLPINKTGEEYAI